MPQRRYWVGLDAGVETTAVCLVDGSGEILFEGLRETRAVQIRDILRRFGVEAVEIVTVEAGVGTHMVRELRSFGYPVQIVELRRSSKFLAIQRQKSDTNDARGLADLGRLGRSIGGTIYLKPMDCQNIRTQLNIRKGLIRQRARLEALLQSIIRLHGGNFKIRAGLRARVLEIEAQTATLQSDGLDVTVDVRPVLDIVSAMRVQVAAMDKRLLETAKSHPVCSNLMTVPGVGPITALSFYSAVGDPWRFSRNTDVGPYFGLTPKVRQSGSTLRVGRVSRFGNKLTRSHLVAAANVLLCCIKSDCALKIWGRRLADKVGLAKARVALARKLAVLMLTMWKSGSAYDPSLA